MYVLLYHNVTLVFTKFDIIAMPVLDVSGQNKIPVETYE
jgi:hypothetical protein